MTTTLTAIKRWFLRRVRVSEAAAYRDLLNVVPKAIKPNSTNSHFGYDFVSIDRFSAVIGPLLRKHGFVVYMNETRCKIIEDKQSMLYTFEMGLSYCGALPATLETATVLVSVASPQAMGQARSYAERQWLARKLVINVGDARHDLDHSDHHRESQPARSTGRTDRSDQAQQGVPESELNDMQKFYLACNENGDLARQLWDKAAGDHDAAMGLLAEHEAADAVTDSGGDTEVVEETVTESTNDMEDTYRDDEADAPVDSYSELTFDSENRDG